MEWASVLGPFDNLKIAEGEPGEPPQKKIEQHKWVPEV